MAIAAAPYVHAKLLASQVQLRSSDERVPPEEYARWARQQVREAFGMPPLTIEHKADVVAVDDKIVPLNPTPGNPPPKSS